MAHTVTCPHCGHRVEEAAFCTNCGQSLPMAVDSANSSAPEPGPTSPERAAASNTKESKTSTGRFGRKLPGSNRGIHVLPVTLSGSTRRYRWIAVIGAVLVLLNLLGGNAGSAIIIATVIVPLLFVSYLYDIDLYEDESRLALLLVGIWGGLVGLGFGAANAWLVGRLWIKDATFHVGAAGFGSRFADAAGLPPVSIFFLTGIALPVIAVALLALGPSALRRFPSFRNEVMDGVTAGAAAGGGFAIATTIVFFWPLITRSANPGLDVGEWTGMLIGLVLLRPLILMAIVAIVCAGVWRLDPRHQTTEQRLPIAVGLGAVVVYALGDLFVQPSGARAEFVWLLVVTVLVWFAFRLIVTSALAEDRQQLGGRNLVVCPHCRKLTPPGAFCVVCGKPLTPAAEAEPQPAAEPAEPVPAVSSTSSPEPALEDAHSEPVPAPPVSQEGEQPVPEAPAESEPPVFVTPPPAASDIDQTRPLPEPEPVPTEDNPAPPEPDTPAEPVKTPSSLPHWLLSNEAPPRRDDNDPDKTGS